MNHAAATPPVMTRSAKATANTISRIRPSTLIWPSLGRDGSAFCEQDHRTQAASEAALNLMVTPAASRVHPLRGLRHASRSGFLCNERGAIGAQTNPSMSFSNTKQPLVAISSPWKTQRRPDAFGAMQTRMQRTGNTASPSPHSSAKPQTRLARRMQLATLHAVQGQLGNDRSFATLRSVF